VRDLVKQGYVGKVLSTSLIGSGMGWGPTAEPFNAYLNDKKNGATMLSIPLGHTADALCHCLGEVRELSATMTARRWTFTVVGTDERKPMNTDDQVCVTGLLEGGAALSIHYRGGLSRGTNLLWEINGAEGDLQLTAAGGHAQMFDVRFARDFREGTHLCPRFDDAVTRHRMLNAIEVAAATGQRQTLE